MRVSQGTQNNSQTAIIDTSGNGSDCGGLCSWTLNVSRASSCLAKSRPFRNGALPAISRSNNILVLRVFHALVRLGISARATTGGTCHTGGEQGWPAQCLVIEKVSSQFTPSSSIGPARNRRCVPPVMTLRTVAVMAMEHSDGAAKNKLVA